MQFLHYETALYKLAGEPARTAAAQNATEVTPTAGSLP
jgi:hypothetical protein